MNCDDCGRPLAEDDERAEFDDNGRLVILCMECFRNEFPMGNDE